MELDRAFHRSGSNSNDEKDVHIEVRLSKKVEKTKASNKNIKPKRLTEKSKGKEIKLEANNLNTGLGEPDFSDEWSDSQDPAVIDDMERSKKLFKDFMVLKNIAGRTKTVSSSDHIPSEVLIDHGDVVEISDNPDPMNTTEKRTSVIVHRDQYGEIKNIEVLCKCGERTVIRLELEDELGQEDVPELED